MIDGIKTKLNWSELDIVLYALDRLKEDTTEESDYPLSLTEDLYRKLEKEATKK